VGHYLLMRLGSRADAEDALQETFVRLARNHRKLATVENLQAYVITVARNEAARLAAGRARRREQGPLAAAELFCCADDDGEMRETAEVVAVALARLSLELREVVELKTYAGLTFQEIAQVTGLPQGTVATRYRTAIAKMRATLAHLECGDLSPLSPHGKDHHDTKSGDKSPHSKGP
jgi:RNA polymerase sigma-70 factor, ECF subfamily